MNRYIFLLLPLLLFGRINPFEPVKDNITINSNIPEATIKLVGANDEYKKIDLSPKDKENKIKKTILNTNLTTLYKPKTIKILQFITIDLAHTYFKVTSRKRYKVLRYYFLKDEKKVVFDFRAKVDMRTRYKKIKNHPFFEFYKIGNHPKLKDYFFRVVVKLKKDISNYTVEIDNNIAIVRYNK